MQCRWVVTTSLLLLVMSFGLAAPSRAGEGTVFTLWPLVDYRADAAIDYRSVHLFGPLLKYETKGEEVEFAVRPLWYRASDADGVSQTEVLYPLAGKRTQPDAEFIDILHLFNYDFGERERGSSNQFYLFPFLFYGDHPEHGRYAAFFPFGGTLYDWFGRDRIDFALFPLYGHTERGTTRNDHVLWPIFSRISGDQEHGFSIWPLYGQSRKEGVYRRQYCLWPIFFREEYRLDSNDPVTRQAIFPFWFEMESRTFSQRSVLWPFFTWIQDRAGEYEQWDAPWPLVRVTRGETRHGLRLLPFYSDETISSRRNRWFLWPVYKIEDFTTEQIESQRHRILFFLYSDRVERKLETGGEQRRIDLWPIFSYHREGGVSRLNVLALLDPMFPDNQAIEHVWSPLWRIYQQHWDMKGNQVVSVLWNLFWYERQDEQMAWEMFPLADYRHDHTAQRLRLLKGLVAVRNDEQQRCVSLFYLPWEACWDIRPAALASNAVPVTAER